MKKIDKLIRVKLVQEAKGVKLEPTPACPSDPELIGYISGSLNQAKRGLLEAHLSECLLCLDKIVAAHEGEKLSRKRKIKKSPRRAIWSAKNIDRISDNLIKDRVNSALKHADLPAGGRKSSATENAVINWLPKSLKKNRWLIASITAFALSFAFPPVFFQFLLAAGILGGKWIFDSENAKTLIMIYNAWKRGGEKEIKETLEVLKDRIPNKK